MRASTAQRAGRPILAALLVLLAAALGGQSIRTWLDLDIEYRYRSSDVYVETSPVKSGIDLTRNYFEVPPFARFGLEAGAEAGLGLALEGELRREFDADYLDGYFSPSNFVRLGQEGDPFAVENAILSRGALYWRSPALDIVFGRDRVDYGKELEGSLYPSLRLPYLDALRARGRIGPIGVDWMLSSLHAVQSFDGNDVEPDDGILSGSYYGFEDEEYPSIVLELLHRLSWDFGRLRVGIAENCILARRNNRFLVTDFLPVISWHQTKIVPNNVTFLFDAAWEAMDGLTLAFQGGFDDINANSFGFGDAGGVPTIGACVLGGRYAADTATGALDAYLETGYTHYLWGNFSAAEQIPGVPDVVPLARAVYRYRLDSGAALLPLTSPYGPGALWLLASGGLKPAGTGLRLGFELLLLGKNTKANLIDTPYDQSAKDGRVSFFGSLTVPVSWKVGDFELSAAPAALVRDGTWWAEATVSASYRLSSEKELRAPAR